MAGFEDGNIRANYPAYAPIYIDANGVMQGIASLGDSGDLFTSKGSSAAPQMLPAIPSAAVGAWTAFSPTIRGTTTAGSATYSFQAGAYQVMNTTCLIRGLIVWSTITGHVGNPAIGNLPFTIKNVSDNNHTILVQSQNWATGDPNSAITSINNDFATLYSLTGAISTFDTAATLWFEGFYEVA